MSIFPLCKWRQDLAPPVLLFTPPFLPSLSKCLCWIVSRFTLEIRAMCLSCRNVQCQQMVIRNPGRILETPVLREGGTSAVKRPGIALPEPNEPPSGSGTGPGPCGQGESEPWRRGSCCRTCSWHLWPRRGLCNPNPPCLHLFCARQSQVGIFWWSFFPAGKFQ